MNLSMNKPKMNKKIQSESNRKSEPSIEHNFDSDILFNIKKYLKKKYQIPINQIKIDHSIKFTAKGYEILGKMNNIEISNTAKLNPVHTPDIIITDKNKIVLIIEQDGKIHESEKVIKKDYNRNRHYTKAEIPFIIINSEKLRLMKKTCQTYLEEELKKYDHELYSLNQ